MPTRGASRGGLSGQLSMNDELVNQLMGSAAGPTKSFSVEQFAEMLKPLAAGGAAGGAATTSANASSPRGRARRGSANPTTSSGSGKTSEEIWKNIQLSGADSLQGPPSILPTPQGSGAFGTLGKLSLPTGSMLFPKKSIEKLVGEHAGGAARPATEWIDLMPRSRAAGTRPAAHEQRAPGAGEGGRAARDRNGREPYGVGRASARGARGASLLGRTRVCRKRRPSAAAAGSKRGRGREEGAAAAPPRRRRMPSVPFTLPPKKKGRKKKGEVDTETEEEKAMRGGEAAQEPGERRAFAPAESRAEGRARKKSHRRRGQGGAAGEGGGQVEGGDRAPEEEVKRDRRRVSSRL